METLTGFKWMGNLDHTLLEKGEEVLFAFEEAIGVMFGTTVLDKDGVSGAAVTGEMAAYLYSNGETFSSLLEDIHLFKIWSSCLKQFLFYMSLKRNDRSL
uniref:Alpha-D-phosphohexomutase alpha/beta/alpha domain-containing protein n=1 Tax=Amphimedon queenslandica TaxID=400682 RepID=A0A1X7UKQ7_AMPQE